MGDQNRFLIIRADADARIGTGHLMRCLALAQAWKDEGGDVIFITACESPKLQQRLDGEGFQVVQLKYPYPNPLDLEKTLEVIVGYQGAWVVLDGYHFDPSYQYRIKGAGCRLLVIDDMAHHPHYYADIVLNQNIYAEDMQYSCEPYTRLLLGTKYVLLRREFLRWRQWKRNIPDIAKKTLVTLGGSDPDNVTLKVIEALQQVEVEGLEAIVVVGAANPHLALLRNAAESSAVPIRLETAVENMSELMAWADIAISAGGSTCWELAFMGLPSLLIVMADNQRMAVKRLCERGLMRNLGDSLDVTPQAIAWSLKNFAENYEERLKIGELGRQLVDGLGVERVVGVLVQDI